MSKPKNTITEYRSYYLPMHFPVLLLSGDHWKISDVPSGRLHFHNCLEIGICHSRSGYIEVFGEKMPFREGDVTVIPKNVPHTTYSTPGTESHWSYLYLDSKELFRNLLPATWQDYDLAGYSQNKYRPILNRKEFPQVHNLALLAIRELEEQKPSFQVSAKGLLLSLFIEIYRIQYSGKNSGNVSDPEKEETSSERKTENALVIAPALNYIEENYMQQFTIEYLADLCHWSPTHFRRVFHDIMGTSPLDFVNNTRVSKACQLLRSTEESVLNISEMVGFHSVSSFNRYFIKIMQMSPRDYRKQILKSDVRVENQSVQEYAGWLFPEK